MTTMRLPSRVVLPLLLLLVVIAACSGGPEAAPGKIKISIQAAGGKGLAGLAIDDCKEAIGANEILKTITIRDEDGVLLHDLTIRGRDAKVLRRGVNGRRCVVRAVEEFAVQTGSTYQVTIDGETSTYEWPVEPSANDQCWGSCLYYPRTVTWNLEARGYVEPPAVDEIQALVDEGYLRMRDISNRWNVPEELLGRIVERDDFPAAKVVGTRRLWLLQEVRTWFSQRQDR